LSGAAQLLLVMLWWAYDLAARFNGWLPFVAWSVPAGRVHPFLMVYGLYSFFFFGFVMTAGPRWIMTAPPSRGRYLAVAGLLVAGMAAFYLGLLFSVHLLALGVLLQTAGIASGVQWWWRSIARSELAELWHARIIAGALSLACLGEILYVWGVLRLDPEVLAASFIVGLWGFVLPVFTTVCHRMVPFFSAGVLMDYDPWRPRWLLFALVGGELLHGLLEIALGSAWTWPVDLPLAALGLLVTLRWQIKRSFAVPLLAMLHVGFAWFGLAMALYGLNGLGLLFTGKTLVGLAALHLLGIGFATSLVLAMVTRVSLGHSGRPLIADRMVWTLFWLLQSAVLLRLAGELLPGAAGHAYFGAAVVWLVCFGLWFSRFGPIFWRPRIDGQDG
jgi:uncharacterized protein involved in response to NO